MNTRTKTKRHRPLSASFDGLVRMMAPMAIRDDVHHGNVVEVIDQLMRIDRLSQGQSDYLETLVELVEAYEAKNHVIGVSKLSGRRMLKYVVEEAGMSASGLARLLGSHPTMGSKILRGDRRLTWDHAKILGAHFKVAPTLFMD